MPVNTKEGSHEPAACPEEPIRDSFKDISHAVGAVGFLLESPKKARALFVNGLVTVWDIPLSANDRVSFPFLPEETDLVPEEGPLTILYEDEVLLAVHKEQGLLVHNSGLTQESSLSRRVLFYYREHGIKPPFIRFRGSTVKQAALSYLPKTPHSTICSLRPP